MSKPIKKVCKNGHGFVKSSDCPVCPICEAERLTLNTNDLPKIGAPATRALERISINTLSILANHTKAELNGLHGLGPKAMTILTEALAAKGMALMPTATASIDTYVEDLPERSQTVVQEIRRRVAAAAPDSVEAIKYGMPTATIRGQNILYYAAWKTHLGMYPIYRGSPEFEIAVAPYRDKKDAVRFPLDEPIPLHIVDLILDTRISVMRAIAEKGKTS